MSYGWLGTFRQGQWVAYRSFILNERNTISQRIATIEAELQRIGKITVAYRSTGGKVTEERVGFSVTSGSSLCKLIQAYIALGGNPFNISLFLSPDSTIMIDEKEIQTQPNHGLVTPISGDYALGAEYKGGYLTVKKYTPARVGGRKELEDSRIASAVDLTRRPFNQTIQYRIHAMEARIIKLCDLREQLMSEIDTLNMSFSGTAGALPTLDQEFYNPDLGVVKIVSSIDGIFYVKDKDGIPDMNKINNNGLESYPSLLTDITPDEDNTNL